MILEEVFGAPGLLLSFVILSLPCGCQEMARADLNYSRTYYSFKAAARRAAELELTSTTAGHTIFSVCFRWLPGDG